MGSNCNKSCNNNQLENGNVSFIIENEYNQNDNNNSKNLNNLENNKDNISEQESYSLEIIDQSSKQYRQSNNNEKNNVKNEGKHIGFSELIKSKGEEIIIQNDSNINLSKKKVVNNKKAKKVKDNNDNNSSDIYVSDDSSSFEKFNTEIPISNFVGSIGINDMNAKVKNKKLLTLNDDAQKNRVIPDSINFSNKRNDSYTSPYKLVKNDVINLNTKIGNMSCQNNKFNVPITSANPHPQMQSKIINNSNNNTIEGNSENEAINSNSNKNTIDNYVDSKNIEINKANDNVVLQTNEQNPIGNLNNYYKIKSKIHKIDEHSRKHKIEVIAQNSNRNRNSKIKIINQSAINKIENNSPSKNINSSLINKSFRSLKPFAELKNTKKKKLWNELLITEVISEKKLFNLNDNDIILKGCFYKINSFNNKNKNSKVEAAALNFFVLKPKEIYIFHSKENFLFNNPPLQKIPLNTISHCDNININETVYKYTKNICKFNFFICMNQEKEILQNKSINCNDISNPSEPQSSDIDVNKNHRFKKMKLLNTYCKNNGNNNSEKSNPIKKKINESTLSSSIIISSNNEELVNEWLCAINYFISK